MIRMGEGAKVSVFTLSSFVGVTRTKFSFVLIWVVKLFYTIMCEGAFFSLGTLLFLHDKLAHHTSVRPKLSAPILGLIVEKGTPFLVMITLTILLASRRLKVIQIKKHDTTFFSCLTWLLFLTLIAFFRALRLFHKIGFYLQRSPLLLASHAWPPCSWSISNGAYLDLWMLLNLAFLLMLINSGVHLFLRLCFLLFEVLNRVLLGDKVKVTTFLIFLVFMVVWAFRGFAASAQELANTCFVREGMVENFILRMRKLTSIAKTAWTNQEVRLRRSLDVPSKRSRLLILLVRIVAGQG